MILPDFLVRCLSEIGHEALRRGLSENDLFESQCIAMKAKELAERNGR